MPSTTDSPAYNGHSSTADLLWAAVPTITRAGFLFVFECLGCLLGSTTKLSCCLMFALRRSLLLFDPRCLQIASVFRQHVLLCECVLVLFNAFYLIGCQGMLLWKDPCVCSISAEC